MIWFYLLSRSDFVCMSTFGIKLVNFCWYSSTNVFYTSKGSVSSYMNTITSHLFNFYSFSINSFISLVGISVIYILYIKLWCNYYEVSLCTSTIIDCIDNWSLIDSLWVILRILTINISIQKLCLPTLIISNEITVIHFPLCRWLQ